MNTKIMITKVRPSAQLPAYQTAGSAAMDLHACIDQPIHIMPMQRVAIPTGIAIALPLGFEAQVRARSGLSSKSGITMVNGVGTIDSDYRGEVSALVINLSEEPFEVTDGLRIAQLVVAKYEQVIWDETDTLDSTDRGSGGFGSTGAI